MDSKKVKQAFKESILFREQTLKKFEGRLDKLPFSEASKILKTLKVDSMSKLKEQVMEGEIKVEEIDKAMPSEQMETDPITEQGDGADIADSPAEAEEGSTSDPNPKGAENRESADGDEDDKPKDDDTSSESADGEEETDTENGEGEEVPFETKVMDRLDNIDAKIESMSNGEGDDAKPNMEESEETEEPAQEEAQPEEQMNEESGDDGEISDDELPEPPVMAENADGEKEETDKEQADDEETDKEKSKSGDFKELFKLG